MADVFVIAIIVAFMAANASTVGVLLNLGARFEPGFYFFLGYCIFSILSIQVIIRKNKVSPQIYTDKNGRIKSQ
jgi:hypothetical protein